MQIGDIRAEVRNAVDIRTTFSPNITFPLPASDAELPAIESKIKSAVSEALSVRGLETGKIKPSAVDVPDDLALMFSIRYSLERELRRIASGRLIAADARPMPITKIARSLSEVGLIEPRLESAIREVYAVCSPAVHGEPVTPRQIAFVRDVAYELVAALRAIS
jgi:hypothetical protein